MSHSGDTRETGEQDPPDSAATSDDRALCLRLGLVGRSTSFQTAFALARRFARCAAPVLIRGQTGNGKELFARAVHHLSDRRGGPFVPVNCGALPDTLVESELFGHARGAFTDAKGERTGLVALANGGTLFLDEVDSLSSRAQVALLRFLQDHEFRRVGGSKVERTDVRILAATNGDLQACIALGRFREDLYFRLDVLSLDLPPLAERREDIGLLARHFLARFAGLYAGAVPQLDHDAEEWLAAQPWPGNVRQLENLMHRAYVLARDGRVRRADVVPGPAPASLPEAEAVAVMHEGGLKAGRERQAREFEVAYLRRLLALTHGNVTEAARRAGTERRAMGRLLKRHGIDKEGFR
ncbi:sigma-54 dependent transcriptional regulator (plasmid) [Azospirillum sp. A26]|uniref:sigma-54 interaction domain-containing protein n=1 Tax=Azospirillum sp. A26 TaxID=3160607 RepID=UPI00366CF73A